LNLPRDIPGDVVEENGAGFPCGLPELVLLDCDLPIHEIRQKSPALFAYLKRLSPAGGRRIVNDFGILIAGKALNRDQQHVRSR
jgi:hypothetical protein